MNVQWKHKDTSACYIKYYSTFTETKGRSKLEKNAFRLGLGLVHCKPLRHGNQSPAEEWAKQKETRKERKTRSNKILVLPCHVNHNKFCVPY